MAGEPLDHAKRCAEFMLDGLRPTDRLAIVSFDHRVETLSPATLLSEQADPRRAIRGIASGGNTNLHGGWLQGAETLAPHTSRDAISRVILLSDGNANAGLCDVPSIFEQCAELARSGVTTSTYGLGRMFNEDLMIGMAKHGQGHSYYGSAASDLMDPFREEFALLDATCARRVKLEVDAGDDVVATMLNDYIVDASGAQGSAWSLPDLAYGGEAWAVLRLKIARRCVDATAAVTLLTVRIRYVGLDGEPRAIDAESLRLPTLPASAFHAIADDELVARRVGEVEAARLQQQARDAARRGEWVQAGSLLERAARAADDNPWVRESLEELRSLADRKDCAMFAKESAFQSHRMQTRLAAHDESADSHRLANVLAYLRRKTNQGKGDAPPQP
jgi:Ca-activated chloride channel family protein